MSRGRLSLSNIEIVFWQNVLLANLKTYYYDIWLSIHAYDIVVKSVRPFKQGLVT